MNYLQLLVVASCAISLVIVAAITPTSSPTVRRYDVMKAVIQKDSTPGIDNVNKAIYIVKSSGTTESGGGAIFKV